MKNPLRTAFPQRFLNRQTPRFLQSVKDMENEIESWFQQSPLSNWSEDYDGFDFAPLCSMNENDKEYILHFDIPGINKDNLKIEIENNRLTVSGERKEETEDKSGKRFWSETYYGSFMRSLPLPSAVNENKIDAHYEDGVLTIKAQKLETSKAKEIKIH